MAQTIGMAGINYGIGRVAALTKAVNKEDLSETNRNFFIRFFLNSCWWAIRNYTQTRKVGIFLNDNTDFDNRIRSIFEEIDTINVEMLDPWHDQSSSTVPIQDLYILIPSYNAFDGIRMSDAKQQNLLYNIGNLGAGMLLGEWFHLLQSIPSKRSFSFIGTDNEGLISASPFNVSRDFLVFTDIDEMTYSKTVNDDSMSFGISPSFYLKNTVIDTPFAGHLTQIASVKENATIYWTTDIASSDPVATTTTTTTQQPSFEEIRLKVFEIETVESCGPLRLFLDGKDKDFFLLEGNEVFLTKYITSPTDLQVSVYAELYYGEERFTYKNNGQTIISPPRVIRDLSIKVIDCESPISKPLDGSRPAYSFRYNENVVTSAWGNYVKTGIINPFDEWYFSGKGSLESPVFAWLGGKHSDVNTLWMQVNQGGTITATLTASNEYRQLNPYALLDAARLFVVTNNPSNEYVPSQHTSDIFETFSNPEEIEIAHNININSINAVRGTDSSTFSFNVETPNAIDPVTEEKIRGNIYLVLCYRKDLFRSENDDRIYLSTYFGTPTTTLPPEYEYTIFIVNTIPDTEVYYADTNNITNGFKIKGTTIDGPLIRTIRIQTVGSNRIFDGNITVEDTATEITTDIRTINDFSKYIDITLSSMPTAGGFATITISGQTLTTTTTTLAPVPRYNVTVEILDGLNNVYLYPDPVTSYKQTQSGTAGSIIIFYFNWATEEGYEYRPDVAIAEGSGPGSTNPSYQYLDRPTITWIQYQSSTNPAIVKLPSPTPNDVGPNEIYVRRGFWNNNWWNIDSNTYGTIIVPVLVPVGGGKVELILGGDPPDATTTPPPTTAPPPECDNSIYVICQQVLSCVESGDGCLPQGSPNSYQQIILSTCCNLTEEEQLSIVRAANSASSNATLSQMYPNCNPTNFSFIGDCLPKDQDGNCQETIHNQIIDVISCGSSENPLP